MLYLFIKLQVLQLQGKSREVKALAQTIDIRSMGMAMTPCILPAVGRPGFELAEDEIEIGMGIHGEPEY